MSLSGLGLPEDTCGADLSCRRVNGEPNDLTSVLGSAKPPSISASKTLDSTFGQPVDLSVAPAMSSPSIPMHIEQISETLYAL